MTDVKPRFFKDQASLRAWFRKHHATETELWCGLYKKSAAHKGVTREQAVDESLCFGWIDGQVKSIDDETWMIRLTPRKQGSHWSAVNLKLVARLIESGAMAEPGMKAYEARDKATAGKKYSFENEPVRLSAAFAAEFRRNKKAWEWFSSSPPGYQRTATFWVMNAKRDETKTKRLRELIADSANGLRIKQLRPIPRRVSRSGRTASGAKRG